MPVWAGQGSGYVCGSAVRSRRGGGDSGSAVGVAVSHGNGRGAAGVLPTMGLERRGMGGRLDLRVSR